MAIMIHFCALMAQFSINNTSFVIGGTMWTAPLRLISMLWTNLSIKTKKVVKNANPFSVSMTKKNSGKKHVIQKLAFLPCYLLSYPLSPVTNNHKPLFLSVHKTTTLGQLQHQKHKIIFYEIIAKKLQMSMRWFAWMLGERPCKLWYWIYLVIFEVE